MLPGHIATVHQAANFDVRYIIEKTICYSTSLFFGLCLQHISFAKKRLIVRDLKARHRIDKELAEAFSTKIIEEIRTLGVYEVLYKGDLARFLKKTDPGCEDTPCLIEFGRAAGTKYVLVGSLSKLGSPSIYRALRQRNEKGRGSWRITLLIQRTAVRSARLKTSLGTKPKSSFGQWCSQSEITK